VIAGGVGHFLDGEGLTTLLEARDAVPTLAG
jgi:hypothetical protein